ncbi:hypothetical protein GCM10017764_17500 [Sphingobacterium griseoflavum]|uniref:Uncharacterized protein n=1 Tax=Sphingobacterium griseoflavum TaxID=1474952 RepID=A0ABQ3HY47_9SPHI|nr:hypothetical protein GCM10017764_17500 [Sphingobacterium griseoflavum]
MVLLRKEDGSVIGVDKNLISMVQPGDNVTEVDFYDGRIMTVKEDCEVVIKVIKGCLDQELTLLMEPMRYKRTK